ncbi:unnamed protein product [Cuscuta epithymum]|uniref:Uncharacterized protein n=1 Tax=Cuscuta epithymum TaxID=186058 RepID=A0AAV0E9R1_9ASTE|nr:unnamed protein product [Cuscuta epithymum]
MQFFTHFSNIYIHMQCVMNRHKVEKRIQCSNVLKITQEKT